MLLGTHWHLMRKCALGYNKLWHKNTHTRFMFTHKHSQTCSPWHTNERFLPIASIFVSLEQHMFSTSSIFNWQYWLIRMCSSLIQFNGTRLYLKRYEAFLCRWIQRLRITTAVFVFVIYIHIIRARVCEWYAWSLLYKAATTVPTFR